MWTFRGENTHQKQSTKVYTAVVLKALFKIDIDLSLDII